MLQPRYDFLREAPMPPWMRSAFGEIGQREITGAQGNPRIMAYREQAHVPLAGDDGQVPWCAIFTNAMLERTRVTGTRSGMARSYVSHASFVRLDGPCLGAIVVLSSNRGAASGHVGFYCAEDGLFVHLLGGNQNDEVNVSPFRKNRIVGCFWPRGAAYPRQPFDRVIKLARPLLPHERRETRDA